MSGTISTLLDIIVPGNSSLLAAKRNRKRIEVRHSKQQFFKSIWEKCSSTVSFFTTHILVPGLE